MYQIPFEIPSYTFDEAMERLHATKKFGIQPLLESVEDMLAELGNPDDHFESVQIAGTNGKTSTSRYTAAILMGEGKRVALYTSPELVCLTERMEVMGRPVSEENFARGMAAAVTSGERVNARRSAAGERPYDITEFDLLTVAALVVFAEAGVDVAVLECGMGGRWDATSAAHNIKSVAVTGIGLDHTRILGDTLEAIAGEKAAIIKPGRACVLGVGCATPTSVEDVFLEQCHAAGVTPTLVRALDRVDVAGEMHPGIAREHAGLPQASFGVTKRPHRLGAPLEPLRQHPAFPLRGARLPQARLPGRQRGLRRRTGRGPPRPRPCPGRPLRVSGHLPHARPLPAAAPGAARPHRRLPQPAERRGVSFRRRGRGARRCPPPASSLRRPGR